VDPDKPFILMADASQYAVGAVLEQPHGEHTRPVGFWSRKLTKGQRTGWSPREKETYAIVEALKKWASWIGFQPVVIMTDHQALESWYKEMMQATGGPSGRRARWHELLSKFDLQVHYIPGEKNTVADALSRWAYPASKALQDCTGHGSLEDYKEVQQLKQEERLAANIFGIKKKKITKVKPKPKAVPQPQPSVPKPRRKFRFQAQGDDSSSSDEDSDHPEEPGAVTHDEQPNDAPPHVIDDDPLAPPIPMPQDDPEDIQPIVPDLFPEEGDTSPMSQPTPLMDIEEPSSSSNQPSSSTRSKGKERQSSSISDRKQVIEDCIFNEDWSDAVMNSARWKDEWQKVHDLNDGNSDDELWPKGFQLRGEGRNLLYFEGKICVPEQVAPQLVQQWHEWQLGHAGIEKMLQDLKARFIIPDVENLVKQVKRGCQVCQSCDHLNRSKHGEWQRYPVPKQPMTSISMDIVSMPSAVDFNKQEVDAALVVIDRFSGWIEAWPVKKKGCTAKHAALLWYHHWINVFGPPTEVITDLGPHFAAAWFKTLCGLKGIFHARAISYHSQSNGAAERAIENILDILRKQQAQKKGDWTQHLPRCLQIHR